MIAGHAYTSVSDGTPWGGRCGPMDHCFIGPSVALNCVGWKFTVQPTWCRVENLLLKFQLLHFNLEDSVESLVLLRSLLDFMHAANLPTLMNVGTGG